MAKPGRSSRPRPPRPPRWQRTRRPSRPLDRPRRRLGGKSIWDFLDLFSKYSIPIAAAIVIAGFGVWQAHLSDLQNQRNQQASDLQNQRNQQAALDQEREGILQTYEGNMQKLLLTYKLGTSAPGGETRQLALVQTLTTLRMLDARRNSIVLRFLREGGIIGTQDPIINLSNTDLSGADLSGADLSGINLANTNLSGATLNNTDLSGATLSAANMTDANLTDANLSAVFLPSAILIDAHMNGADLTNATLTGALLGDAHLDDATLTTANLEGADLSGTDLSRADLNNAELDGANLTGTDLSDTDLSDAHANAIDLTQPELDTVQSCTNATLSLGLICKHNTAIALTYWYTESPAERPVIGRLIRKFEQQNPKIRINAASMNYYQTQTAFEKVAEEDKAPDVLRSDVSWIGQFASQGYLQNIDSYFPQGEVSDYLSAPLSYDYYDGNLYGLPQVTDFLALLYNKAELKNAGVTIPSPPSTITMTEFAKDAQQVARYRAARYGFETDGTSYSALPFLYAFGGGMLDQQGNILVNKPGSVAGLTFLLKLQNTGVMPENVNYSNGGPVTPPVTDFKNGKTAMIFGGPYDIPEILTGPSFKSNPGNLGIAEIPACPPDGSMVWSELNVQSPTCHAGQTGTPSGGQSYVISADTRHPFEAYKFISFMSSTARQVEIAKANGTLPTRKSAYSAISGKQFISEFLPITPTIVDQPAIPQASDLFEAFDPKVEGTLDGVESPIAALNAVAVAWKQLLAG